MRSVQPSTYFSGPLLKSVSGFNTYRRIFGEITPSGVVDFLVLNKYFPRSIFFSLDEAVKCLYKISDSSRHGFSNSAEKALGSLRSQLEYYDVSDVINYGLHEFLDNLQFRINEVSDAIHNNFFKIENNFSTQQTDQ